MDDWRHIHGENENALMSTAGYNIISKVVDGREERDVSNINLPVTMPDVIRLSPSVFVCAGVSSRSTELSRRWIDAVNMF